jgi:hypothetical protein
VDDRGSVPGKDSFLFATVSRPSMGPTQPPSQWVLGAKPPGCEADHSSPSSAEVKNAWSYTSIPPYVFMVWCLIKHRMDKHGNATNAHQVRLISHHTECRN